MTRAPATVQNSLTLADAQDRMYANNLRHLPVTSESGSLVGMISQRDIAVAAALSGKDLVDLVVGSAMSHSPFTCGPAAHLDAVAKEMEGHRYGCAVVVEEGRAVGIFTTTDALWALRQFISGKPVDREVKPTHAAGDQGERKSVPHPRMDISGASPNANQGRIRP